jgi:demethylmenaquinone methyltransferase/2-methoxy-6-polyprenyl-1,4-benzoquinol methylase
MTMRLRDLDLDRHLADPAIKQQFVTPMFDLIAPSYDRFTRLFSYGMDAGWKRTLLAEAKALAPTGTSALDLACGTGDIAVAIAAGISGATVCGIDASAEMIELAERRLAVRPAPGVTFTVGDMGALDAADASVDLITAGYGYRNVPDHRGALGEAARALKPGGTLVTLDFYRPEFGLWRALFLWYLRTTGNIVGWLWHREPVAYGYIAPSINSFVSWRTFNRDLEAAGFAVVNVHRYLFGAVAIHVATLRAKSR